MRYLFFSILCFVELAYGTVNFDNIKENALLSAAAYRTLDNASAVIAGTDYKLVHQATLEESGVSYFLARNSARQVLSFRGTSNLENVLVDLKVSLMLDSKFGIQLHRGFAETSSSVLKYLAPSLDKSIPIVITGHSLGGAVAVIVAFYLQQEGYDVQQVVTFGQPKVTNVGGAASFNDLPLLRVVTVKDIVPLVPPISPLQLKELDIYWHVGEEIILLPGQEYSSIRGIKSMLRATTFTSSLPDESNIKAHQMATYLDLINQKIPRSKEVPFKSGVNIFGFSLD